MPCKPGGVGKCSAKIASESNAKHWLSFPERVPAYTIPRINRKRESVVGAEALAKLGLAIFDLDDVERPAGVVVLAEAQRPGHALEAFELL